MKEAPLTQRSGAVDAELADGRVTRSSPPARCGGGTRRRALFHSYFIVGVNAARQRSWDTPISHVHGSGIPREHLWKIRQAAPGHNQTGGRKTDLCSST